MNTVRWRVEMRAVVEEYLAREGVEHTAVPLIPNFATAPYVSLWHCKPDVWIIAGDPNDRDRQLELADLLGRRAAILLKWSTDDDMWEDPPLR